MSSEASPPRAHSASPSRTPPVTPRSGIPPRGGPRGTSAARPRARSPRSRGPAGCGTRPARPARRVCVTVPRVAVVRVRPCIDHAPSLALMRGRSPSDGHCTNPQARPFRLALEIYSVSDVKCQPQPRLTVLTVTRWRMRRDASAVMITSVLITAGRMDWLRRHQAAGCALCEGLDCQIRAT